MKRLILTVFVLIMCSVSAVSAEDLTANISVENELIEGTVTVDGAGASEVVSIRVLDGSGAYNFADILYTNKNGEVSFKYINLGATGTYTLTAYVPKQDKKVDVDFKYYDATYRETMKNAFNDIRSQQGSASAYITTYSDVLDITEYYSQITDSTAFDKMLLNVSGEVSDVSEINKMLNDAVLLTLVNGQHSSELLKNMFLDEKFEEYSNFISNGNGESLLSSMNSDIQNAFYNSVAGRSYTSKQEMIQAEKIIL